MTSTHPMDPTTSLPPATKQATTMTEQPPRTARREDPRRDALRPLLVDVAVPLAIYYGLTKAFGVDTVPALVISSVPPAISTVWTALTRRTLNALGALMLTVNIVGIGVSLLTGDPRLMLAKDGAVSSTIGIAILLSAIGGAPLMATAVKPLLVKGDAAKGARWDTLSAAPGAFRTTQRLHSAIWGLALLGDCVARVICAYTLPVHTVVWLNTVIVLGAIAVAIVASQPLVERMEKMLEPGSPAV
ncbi:VC0807 family protein [Streptomyces sp. NBC_01497]|uniref:VC0807 family protein n=1 Tax=Streptomyces sp. NBC_01497 TaxID=2903885 RepID=UPI002E36D4AC|nr:VC0807 family protein [Streptomyces sp. NBC_01497]